MNKILLNDILNFNDEEIENVKVKFNRHNGYQDPLEIYKSNPDEVNVDWFLWCKKKHYFHKGQIGICLLKLSNDLWLMTTIKQITKELDVNSKEGNVGYEATEVEKYKKYFGRVLVKYHKTERTMDRNFKSVMDNLEVLEILNEQFTGTDFPGYENVRLSYSQLKTVVERMLPGWVAALHNQKAVYLITDTKTGKLYVGSATSQDGMLFQRWSDYVHNGHGGNKELKILVQEKGFDYVKDNFQYSILENYNARMDDNYIFKRETWWKETLKSKEFGYNKN